VSVPAAELLAPRLEQRIIPGLDRVTVALDRLGHPERAFASVLVVGTNGKGATSALLESILSAHGVRTGLYTSPHLVHIEERIRVDGRCIAPDDLAALVDALGRFPELSYFETLTVAALQHFAASGVQVAVLEAGLGGRWDAVNAVEPVLSLLTNVGTDHQAWLGPTRGHVAAEKAAALRGREAIVGVWDGEVEPVIRAHAEAPLSLASAWAEVTIAVRGPGSGLRNAEPSPGPSTSGLTGSVTEQPHEAPLASSGPREEGWAGPRTPDPGPHVDFDATGVHGRAILPLLGAHQLANLQLALAGAAALSRHGAMPALDGRAVARGIEAVRWPGRLQWVEHEGRRLLLDGAHNREATAALCAALDTMGLEGRVDLLFSCLQDKPLAAMAALLAPRVCTVTVVRLDSPRALPTHELAAAFPGAAEVPDVATALAMLSRERPTLATGSLYLVGAILGVTGGIDG
jgi:dihydrofolate synthase/folylpolyglutamate synthase